MIVWMYECMAFSYNHSVMQSCMFWNGKDFNNRRQQILNRDHQNSSGNIYPEFISGT
jgi:hypothetical protein